MNYAHRYSLTEVGWDGDEMIYAHPCQVSSDWLSTNSVTDKLKHQEPDLSKSFILMVSTLTPVVYNQQTF